MDNRKIYKKQKSKSSLYSKVTNFLSRSVWNSKATKSLEPNDEQVSNTSSFRKPEQHGNDETIASVNFKNILATPTRTALTDVKTPNVLLSEFFQQKGNTPLSAIEYEGVMSLLSQSHKKELLMPGTFTTSPVKLVNSVIEDTPTSQKVLNKTSSPRKYATPNYRPIMHDVPSSEPRVVPSVKRVYQFSGLPSPYRTKIKTPNMISNKRFKDQTFDKSLLDSSINSSHKPINKAASTLLSVLDDSKAESSSNYIEQFSNPYLNSRKANNLTAAIINSTLSFDKNVDIPVSLNSSIPTPAQTTSFIPEKTIEKSEPKDEILANTPPPITNEEIDFGIRPNNIMMDPNVVVEQNIRTMKLQEKVKQEEPKKVEVQEINSPTDTSVDLTSQNKDLPNGFKPAFQVKPVLSTTNINPTFQPNSRPNVPDFNVKSSNKAEPVFEFPILVTQPAQLDNTKVEKYKASFTFNV